MSGSPESVFVAAEARGPGGQRLVTGATALLLTLENAFGNGLFVNLIFEAKP